MEAFEVAPDLEHEPMLRRRRHSAPMAAESLSVDGRHAPPKAMASQSTMYMVAGMFIALCIIAESVAMWVIYMATPPETTLVSATVQRQEQDARGNEDKAKEDLKALHAYNDQYSLVAGNILNSFSTQRSFVYDASSWLASAPKEHCVESQAFMRAGMWNLSLLFCPRGLDGKGENTTLRLNVPCSVGWHLDAEFSANGNVIAASLGWEVQEDAAEFTANLTGTYSAGEMVKLGVHFLNVQPPGENPTGSGTVSSNFPKRSISRTLVRNQVEWAMIALMRTQSADREMLPRALRSPTDRTSFTEQDLKDELARVGPAMVGEQHKIGDDWFEDKLRRFIGMEPLKNQLRAMRDRIEYYHRKTNMGLANFGGKSVHMSFKGNPGVGKTDVAKLVQEMLYDMGEIKEKKTILVQRGDLVGGVIGSTAPKTRAHIDKAKGGILFVDEAYRLVGGGTDFGQEAIDEIMKDMTTGDPVVILAGYPDPMKKLIDSNPGLTRRIEWHLDFPDYSASEIAEICLLKMRTRGFLVGPEITVHALTNLLEEQTTKAYRKEVNGAIANKLVDEAEVCLAERLPKRFKPEDALTIRMMDLSVAAKRLAKGTGE